MRAKPRVCAVGGIGVVCAKCGPVVVGAEVEVFVLVCVKGRVNVHAGCIFVCNARVHAVNGCPWVGCVGLLQHAVVIGICQRHDHGINVGLAVQPFGGLVDQSGIPLGICLVLIVHFVGGVACDVVARDGLHLDVLAALLPLLVAHVRGTTLELLRGKALKRGDGIVDRDQCFAKRIGVGKPGADLLCVLSREKGGKGKGGEIGQVALFGFRVLGSQKESKPQHKADHHYRAKQHDHDFVEYMLVIHIGSFLALKSEIEEGVVAVTDQGQCREND